MGRNLKAYLPSLVNKDDLNQGTPHSPKIRLPYSDLHGAVGFLFRLDASIRCCPFLGYVIGKFNTWGGTWWVPERCVVSRNIGNPCIVV